MQCQQQELKLAYRASEENLTVLKPFLTEMFAPLYETFGIEYFQYYRTVSPNDYLCISTHPVWFKTRHEFKLTQTLLLDENKETNVIAWSDFDNKEVLTLGKKVTGIVDGFTMVNKLENGYEVLEFGVKSNENNMAAFYLQHRSMLHKYAQFVRGKLAGIEQDDFYRNSLFFSQVDKLYLIESSQTTQSMHEDFLSKIQSKAVYVPHKNKMVKLSAREIEIVKYYLLGYPAKSIGNNLFVSPRTVEKHVSNVYEKLELTKRYELHAFFRRHHLM